MNNSTSEKDMFMLMMENAEKKTTKKPTCKMTVIENNEGHIYTVFEGSLYESDYLEDEEFKELYEECLEEIEAGEPVGFAFGYNLAALFNGADVCDVE